MRCFATIFLVFLAVALVLGIRHRRVLITERHASTTWHKDSTDVAATLRELSGATDSSDPDKGWATRFAQFVNEHPGRQWVVGRCTTPCLSESEAAQQARQDAAQKLYPIVERHVRASRADAQWLADRVALDVREGRFEADRFTEQFKRPYGEVWTESVLLDVTPDNLDSFVNQYRTELSERQVKTRRHVATAAIVILLSGLLYILLNIATRGYFTMRLRLATIVIVTATIILLV
ncbi:MAG TPA: hypothetical protein VK797_10105 [Tepidisphaeraceae bacterium]|jgi:hypothetical protein|nr:hypothetical protein [Tepidisphaeraceae bacterium]